MIRSVSLAALLLASASLVHVQEPGASRAPPPPPPGEVQNLGRDPGVASLMESFGILQAAERIFKP